MDLQFVFGNPTRGKSKKTTKNKKKALARRKRLARLKVSSKRIDTKAFSASQREKVGKVLSEFKKGKLKSHGKKVTKKKMALAIALSEVKNMAKRKKKKASKKKFSKKKKHSSKKRKHSKPKKVLKKKHKTSRKARRRKGKKKNPQVIQLFAKRGKKRIKVGSSPAGASPAEVARASAAYKGAKEAASMLRRSKKVKGKQKKALLKAASKNAKRAHKAYSKLKSKRRYMLDTAATMQKSAVETASGQYKIKRKNVYRRQPMKRKRNPGIAMPLVSESVAPQVERALGVSVNELLSFGLAGATQGLAETGAVKLLKLSTLDKYIPAQVVPYAAPLAGIGVSVGVQKLAERFTSGKTRDFLVSFSKVHLLLSAARVAQVAFGPMLQGVLGMAGVNFTPVSGVNFTPVSGVQFTPVSGQMGTGADFGRLGAADYGGDDGYTEAHKTRPADFGRMGSIGMDEELSDDEEPILENSMSGMA